MSLYKPQTGGPVRAYPRPYEFPMDPWIRTPHLLHNQATSQARTFTHSHSTVLPPCSLNLKDMVSLLKRVVTRVPFGSWSDSPSASWGRPEFEPGSYHSDEWGSQVGSWAFPVSFVQLELALSACWREAPSPGTTCSHGRGGPPSRLGMLSWWQGGENATFQIPGRPQKCCRRAQTETERAPKLSGSKFIKQTSSDSVDWCPKAEPWEQRGFHMSYHWLL
jgi:hypothetical protein